MSNYNPYELPGDPHNPYAPPEADLGRAGYVLKGGIVVEPFSIGAVLRMAWSIFTERMWFVVGLVIVANFLNFGFQITFNVLQSGGMQGQGQGPLQGNPGVGEIVFAVLIVVFAGLASIWLKLGEYIALTRLSRGENASFGDLFSGGRYIIGFILAAILNALCVYGVILVAVIPLGLLAFLAGRANQNATLPIIIIAVVLVAIAAIIVTVRLYFYSYALVDRGLGVIDSLTYSYRISKGHTVSIIGLMIVASIIGVSGLLACGFGMIITFPLSMLMYSCAYVILSNQPEVAHFKLPGSDLVEL